MAPAQVVLLAPSAREMRPLSQRAAHRTGDAIQVHLVGVGKAAAACETALVLSGLRPHTAILAGCAGAFPSSGLRVGDVVAAGEEVFADEGVAASGGFLDLQALGLPMTDLGGEPVFLRAPVAAPGGEALAAANAAVRGRFILRVGRLATVSTCSGSAEAAREIEARCGPLAESMEGAACALASARLGIRFHEVRGISNIAGPRDREAWDVDLACEHAADVAWALALAAVHG